MNAITSFVIKHIIFEILSLVPMILPDLPERNARQVIWTMLT